MVPFAPPADQHAVVKKSSVVTLGPGWGISSQCEDPVTVIKFMDFFFTEEGDELINWVLKAIPIQGMPTAPAFYRKSSEF